MNETYISRKKGLVVIHKIFMNKHLFSWFHDVFESINPMIFSIESSFIHTKTIIVRGLSPWNPIELLSNVNETEKEGVIISDKKIQSIGNPSRFWNFFYFPKVLSFQLHVNLGFF